MSDETKTKKLRLYKFASEFNLSTDTLMEFLQKKGYDVKSHMSLLSDDMLSDINSHFKKDIEKAEKHYKKISEFQKKHGDKGEPGTEKEETKETEEKPVEEEVKIIDAVIEEPAQETVEEVVEQVEEPVSMLEGVGIDVHVMEVGPLKFVV